MYLESKSEPANRICIANDDNQIVKALFLAVKPKSEEFNTILTTKLNDPVLKMASFVTNLQ